jgi:hydrogenase 3 maturation protease
MTVKKKVLLGIGNRLKMDDSAGSVLAERLADSEYLAIDGGIYPESYSGVIKREKPDLLIIVDIALMGLSPGQFRRLPGFKISTDSPMDTHSLSPAYFMDYIKGHAGEIMFVGIEPKEVDFGEQMSPEVLAALDELEEILLSGNEHQIEEI